MAGAESAIGVLQWPQTSGRRLGLRIGAASTRVALEADLARLVGVVVVAAVPEPLILREPERGACYVGAPFLGSADLPRLVTAVARSGGFAAVLGRTRIAFGPHLIHRQEKKQV